MIQSFRVDKWTLTPLGVNLAYAGAKILGAVKVGAHARIGANAVVLSDIEIGGIAVGCPT
jgi:serine acetyltransferase